MDFKSTLSKLLDENNITQTKLAKALGFTPQAVSRWCNGDAEPDTKVLKKIADYFAISVDYLLGHVQTKSDEEINTIKHLLIKNGIIKPKYDISKEEINNIIRFIKINKDYLVKNKY